MRMTINNHIFGEDAWALGLVLLRLDRSWLELLVVFNAEHGQQGPVANKSVSLRGSPQAATLPGFVCLFFNSILFYFLKIIYLLIFRQRGREERNILYGCLLCAPYWGPSPQPRPVLWLGIQTAALSFSGQRSIHWATPARAEWVFKLLYYTVTRIVLSKIREVGQNALPRNFREFT